MYSIPLFWFFSKTTPSETLSEPTDFNSAIIFFNSSTSSINSSNVGVDKLKEIIEELKSVGSESISEGVVFENNQKKWYTIHEKRRCIKWKRKLY